MRIMIQKAISFDQPSRHHCGTERLRPQVSQPVKPWSQIFRPLLPCDLCKQKRVGARPSSFLEVDPACPLSCITRDMACFPATSRAAFVLSTFDPVKTRGQTRAPSDSLSDF